MAGLSGFTFVATCFIVGLVGIVYIFVSPLFKIFMEYATSLSPGMDGVYQAFQLFWNYLPFVCFIGLIVFYIINSMSLD